jgi:hypothetical protein
LGKYRTRYRLYFTQINQEAQASLKVTDGFATTDISQMIKLKSEPGLLQYNPSGQENYPEKFCDLDPDLFYQTGAFLPIITI